MADFKLCIADPKSGKTYQKEIKDKEGDIFLGKNIGEKINGESIGMNGFELEISGGSDKGGFPMRRGILGVRKKLTLLGGIGLRKNFSKGIKKRKTVCGHKITDSITQINLKVTKEGTKKLATIFGGEEAKDGKSETAKEQPKDDKDSKAEDKK